MSVPRMTSLFLLSEVSMHAWKNLGYDPEAKDFIEKTFGPDYAYDVAIGLVAMLEPERRTKIEIERALLTQRTGDDQDPMIILLRTLKRSPPFKKALRASAAELKRVSDKDPFKAADMLFALVDKFPQEAPENYEKAETFADAGHGWRWVEIDGLNCQDHEGRLMQHCGASWGTMYSLRDPQGKPHVSAEISDTSVDQLKGKQNAIVAKKYWPACEKLFNVLVKNGGRPPKFKDSMYINNKLGEEFMIHMKERGLIQVPNMNGKNIEDVQNFEDMFDENPAQWNDNDIFGAN